MKLLEKKIGAEIWVEVNHKIGLEQDSKNALETKKATRNEWLSF
jgi:hypothetical protein